MKRFHLILNGQKNRGLWRNYWRRDKDSVYSWARVGVRGQPDEISWDLVLAVAERTRQAWERERERDSPSSQRSNTTSQRRIAQATKILPLSCSGNRKITTHLKILLLLLRGFLYIKNSCCLVFVSINIIFFKKKLWVPAQIPCYWDLIFVLQPVSFLQILYRCFMWELILADTNSATWSSGTILTYMTISPFFF
jgi:hypothetical protein